MTMLASSPLSVPSTSPLSPAPEPASGREQRSRARVLIVESNTSVAHICLRALQHDRLLVRLAPTTFDAWQLLDEWRPQMIFVGDEFEECQGLELVGRLRSHTNAPIILLAATDSVGYLSSCLEAGADDVIVRPIMPPLLLGKCQAHLRRAYRYSVPPAPPKPAAPLQKHAEPLPTPAPARRENAPVTPEAPPPSSNFSSWPKCEGCGYLGPRTRFEKRNAEGVRTLMCPSCRDSRVRFPVG